MSTDFGISIGRGPEMGPEIGDEVHFSQFLNESGRLSGSHMTAIATDNPMLAAHILDEFVDSLPESDQPADLAEAIAMIEWSDEDEVIQFLEAIDKEEE